MRKLLIIVALAFAGLVLIKGFQLVKAIPSDSAVLEESGSMLYPPGTHKAMVYDLRSYDHGFSWQVITNRGMPHIAGNVDDVYPGLLDQVKGMKRLLAWNQTHGPIDLHKPEVREMLTEAGYTPKH